MKKDTLITFGMCLAWNKPSHVRPLSNCFQTLVECHGIADDGWIRVKRHNIDNNDFFDLNPEHFLATFTPKFLNGETVYVPRKSCNAIVYCLDWHFKRDEYIYSLMFDGKKNSRRYFVDELEKKMRI